MGAAETKDGHEEEYIDGISAVPWPQLDGVNPRLRPPWMIEEVKMVKPGAVRSTTQTASKSFTVRHLTNTELTVCKFGPELAIC